jgi:hypothetical protein
LAWSTAISYNADVPQTTTPPKKDVARALLLRGSVFVHLDPRVEGVEVPEWLRDQPQLVLQIGLDMPIPIPDLRVDDFGVFGTLHFQQAPFTCRVQWESVFALVGEDGLAMVWPEDLPSEIAAEVEREAERRERPLPRPSTARSPDGARPQTARSHASKSQASKRQGSRPQASKPQLSLIDCSSGAPPEDESASRRRPADLPPYLRVIK